MNADLMVVGVVVLLLAGCWHLLRLEVAERNRRWTQEAALYQAKQHMQEEVHQAEVPHKKPRYRSPEVEQRFF